MTKIDHAAILHRIRVKLQRRLPIGCRVRMTREAIRQWPKYNGIFGTVVRYSAGGTSPSVHWDGRKTETSYHPDFIQRIRK